MNERMNGQIKKRLVFSKKKESIVLTNMVNLMISTYEPASLQAWSYFEIFYWIELGVRSD